MTLRTDANPDGDIAIEITGLREGEKLYEELLIGNNPVPTQHRRIMMAMEPVVGWGDLETSLTALRTMISNNEADAIRAMLVKLIPDYVDSRQPEKVIGLTVASFGCRRHHKRRCHAFFPASSRSFPQPTIGLALVTGLTLGASGINFISQALLAYRFGTGIDVDSYAFSLSIPIFVAGLVASIISYTVVPLIAVEHDNPSDKAASALRSL